MRILIASENYCFENGRLYKKVWKTNKQGKIVRWDWDRVGYWAAIWGLIYGIPTEGVKS